MVFETGVDLDLDMAEAVRFSFSSLVGFVINIV